VALLTGVTGQQGSYLAERRRTPAAPVDVPALGTTAVGLAAVRRWRKKARAA